MIYRRCILNRYANIDKYSCKGIKIKGFKIWVQKLYSATK